MTDIAVQRGRIAHAFAKARSDGRTALVPYVMCGDPDLQSTQDIVRALVVAGADLIELGVPFSDPLADGPVIQSAGLRALASGTTVAGVLGVVRELRGGDAPVAVPIVLMGYINPMLAYGFERFARDARAAGVDALIVPDLPLHEASDLLDVMRANDISLVPLVAPTSTDAHIRAAVELATATSGFVYCIAVAGVTGARTDSSSHAPALVARVQASGQQVPTVVGFGVSTRQHVMAIGAYADGAVVGSALVAALDASSTPAVAAADFINQLLADPA